VNDPRARAIAAQQFLDSEMFAEIFDGMEREAIDRLATAPLSDPSGLIEATADLQAIRRVRETAQQFVATGTPSERVPPSVA
jgi:hypothetical protein